MLRRRYKKYHFRVENKGNGGALKYSVFNDKGVPLYFLKVLPRSQDFWYVVNVHLNPNMDSSVPSSAIAIKVVKEIANIEELRSYTLIERVEENKREIWCHYIEQINEIYGDYSSNAEITSILQKFRMQGYTSFDHKASNVVMVGDKYYLIDIDSFNYRHGR